MDGGSVVPEHTQIQSLKHLESNLIALWTVNAEREPLGEASSSRQNALSSKINQQQDVVRTKSEPAKVCFSILLPVALFKI